MEIRFFQLPQHNDSRGNLVAIEAVKDIPFDIKRVYYIYETEQGVVRGFHAHKRLQQALICVHGSCKIMLDNGTEKTIVPLNNPAVGLYVANNIWREMFDFSPGAVLLVLASEHYDENDYIRNYKDFLKYVNEEEGEPT
jgi:dTDP-4-dehydrorhamnose 3,5-epimerase-like enzyme